MDLTTGVRFLAGAVMFLLLFAITSRPAMGSTHLPIQWLLGGRRRLFPAGVKWNWTPTSVYWRS